MDDKEIVGLCAEACGWKTKFVEPHGIYVLREKNPKSDWNHYDPLHDDAQCFALVKKFSLQIHHHGFAGSRASLVTVTGKWLPYGPEFKAVGKDDGGMNAENLAICECVAKLQMSKNNGK